ncbi:hypothetical protein CMV_027502, partial [Castanea mollissima]
MVSPTASGGLLDGSWWSMSWLVVSWVEVGGGERAREKSQPPQSDCRNHRNRGNGIHRGTRCCSASQVQVQRRGSLVRRQICASTLLVSLRSFLPPLDAITLIGFMFLVISALLGYIYSPRLDSAPPRWVHFAHGLLLFLYQ